MFLITSSYAESANKEDGLRVVPITLEPFESGGKNQLYTMKATDLPRSSYGIFKTTKVDGKSTSSPIYLNEDGKVMTGDSIKTRLVFGGVFGYGEWLNIEITPSSKEGKPLKNNKMLGMHHFVPSPLQAIDNAGHKLTIEPIDQTGCHFRCMLSGFKPGEKIKITSRSYEEEIEGTIPIDENGEAQWLSSPAVVGKAQGPFEITVQDKNMKPLVLQHYWGKIAFTPTDQYQKVYEKYPKFAKNS